jgi:hypothetical protein
LSRVRLIKAYLEIMVMMTIFKKVNTFSVSNIIKSQPQAYRKRKRRKLLGESVSPRNGIEGRILQCRKYFWYRIPQEAQREGRSGGR